METTLHNPSSLQANLNWLTEKEKQVLWLIAMGLNSKAIAVRLDVRPKSVDNYKNRIGKKLGLKGYGALVSFIRANNVFAMTEKTTGT
ncbi:hypothetical protein DYBT9275_03537 [Dyadobacter sp. CECT 9275]|uniref:HTH luxR-type domain-containing protein n=1 Tax=Dyadobacter helix TaxID=2822344 RepID=A0A916NCL5_9BACT|nr:helix-turn-helix transcriptional regulator [Dyadobacter sp. CECT 9275]CAG5005205.1 hypothetical protein DYBT9275_03537 [Dyadobacter sp. CECT 9275]